MGLIFVVMFVMMLVNEELKGFLYGRTTERVLDLCNGAVSENVSSNPFIKQKFMYISATVIEFRFVNRIIKEEEEHGQFEKNTFMHITQILYQKFHRG